MEAWLVREDATLNQGLVRCCYCKKTHQHGLMERPTLVGQTRGSHCSKGDYTIVAKKPVKTVSFK